MKHPLLLLTALLCLSACHTTPSATAQNTMTGQNRDAHGCLPSAGQSWSQLRQQCLQAFSEADIRLPDPANDTLAVYVLLSPDRQQAELFAADLPQGSALLSAVKGGYASHDGRVRLLQDPARAGGWRIVK